MALVRWFRDNDIFEQMERMQRDMNRLWSSYMPQSSSPQGVYPPINVYDNGEVYVVRAELPGVDPKDIDINVTADTLSIKGKREIDTNGGSSYHRRERDAGTFNRAFTLPEKIDHNKVTAKTKNGILEIVLPRAPEAQTRKIEIKANQ